MAARADNVPLDQRFRGVSRRHLVLLSVRQPLEQLQDHQQTATLGLVLIAVGAVRARAEFRTDTWFVLYMVGLVVALLLNIALHLIMDRRAGSTVEPRPSPEPVRPAVKVPDPSGRAWRPAGLSR